MTAALLLRALCEFLRKTVADYAAAQSSAGGYVPPTVFDWYLPFKDARREDIDFPFITARIVNGDDPVDDPSAALYSTVRIDLAFGVYSGHRLIKPNDDPIHPDGAYDLLNLMEHVRTALFREGIIDRKFRIERPYKWSIPEEQPYPLWVGEAQTIWTVQSATQQNNEGVDLYGDRWPV
ncbi:hypothetical protein [Paenibacillus sp. GCM10027626]|uniref:hypothetical protein n=1 Tax=Paenibacillus sp. GCM10027626 TaxID=3273411 RepID=UPI003637F601